MYVHAHAPISCQTRFICRGHLIYSRYAWTILCLWFCIFVSLVGILRANCLWGLGNWCSLHSFPWMITNWIINYHIHRKNGLDCPNHRDIHPSLHLQASSIAESGRSNPGRSSSASIDSPTEDELHHLFTSNELVQANSLPIPIWILLTWSMCAHILTCILIHFSLWKSILPISIILLIEFFF